MASCLTDLCYFSILFAQLIVSFAFFDIDEINNVHYGIELIPKPVLSGQLDSAGGIGQNIVLSTKHGQQYQCSFRDKKVETEREEKEEQTAKDIGISDLLKPLEDGPCLIANKGWWTYEFCYGKHIQQYHIEDNKVRGNVLVLGVYASEFDWDRNEKPKDSNKERLRRYHSQQYTNGTECDLTNQPRKAEVRFICDDSTGDSIAAIDEAQSCVYVILVKTHRICHHPYLKPPRQNNAVPITCNPVLSAAEYEEYENENEAKKLLEEQRRKEKAKYFEEATQTLTLDDLFGEEVDDVSMEALGHGKVLNKFKKAMLTTMKRRTEKTKSRRRYTQPSPPPTSPNIGYQIFNTKRDRRLAKWEKLIRKAEIDLPSREDNELIEEFRKGLDEIVKDPESRKSMPTIRDQVEEAMTDQFSDILREAQNELQEEGMDPLVDEKLALSNLAGTLDTLLDKLDQTSLELDEANERLAEATEKSAEARAKLRKEIWEEDTESGISEQESQDRRKRVKAHTDTMTRLMKKKKTEDDNTPTIKMDDEDRLLLPENQRLRLERQVKQELKKHGLDAKHQKIQVKIISTNDEGTTSALTDDDTKSFTKMVVAILGRDGGEDAEADRQANLMSAYEYRWQPDPQSSHTQSGSDTKPESTDDEHL